MLNSDSALKAVFFDLDDTLTDHRYSRRCGLRVLQDCHPFLKAVRIEALELEHERLLLANFAQTLDGSLPLEEAMTERIRLLCTHFGETVSHEEAKNDMTDYWNAYNNNRRAVPGAYEILKRLHGRYILGVITNGHPVHQLEKLKNYGFDAYLDFMLASEEIGYRKPAPDIFREALSRAGVEPHEAMMIGDNWHSDVVGAVNCGLRAVWLNRYEIACPAPDFVPEIKSWHDPLLKTFSLPS